MTRARLLVIEDDATLRDGLRAALRSEDFEVHTASDGEAGARRLAEEQFDLVLLDLMLPRRSGLDVLRGLRARDTDTPVLILTARGEESDKVLGLELGADDYVTKPFGIRELVARVRVQLRRGRKAVDDAPAPFRLGDRKIDLAAYRILHEDGGERALSPREAGILGLLYRARGRAVSRAEILDAVWGSGRYVSNRGIDTHVLHLRQKVEADPRRPRFLLTVHGVGYRLDLDA